MTISQIIKSLSPELKMKLGKDNLPQNIVKSLRKACSDFSCPKGVNTLRAHRKSKGRR